MLEHPYLDVDGDGHPDPYDTYYDGHQYQFIHHDSAGRVDAIAYDYNDDGDGDGIMDTSRPV
jgi:hypothetical protein